MPDELIVLFAPAALGYGLGSLPLVRRMFDGQHAAWAVCIAAATGFIAYAMVDGGALYLQRWAPTFSLMAGVGLTVLHIRLHLRDRGRGIRARRDGMLMEIRLRGRQDDL